VRVWDRLLVMWDSLLGSEKVPQMARSWDSVLDLRMAY